MSRRPGWWLLIGVIALGAILWRARSVERPADLTVESRRPEAARTELPPRGEPAPSSRTAGPLVAPAPLAREEPQPPLSGGAEAVQPVSPLAQFLAQVEASFLTEQPRVAETLELVQGLALHAVVAPENLEVEWRPDGELSSARGLVDSDDLRGTFLVDADGYHVSFSCAVDDPEWEGVDFHVTFQEGESGPRGCHAVVQFHPRPREPGSPASQAEVLVGWTVGTDPSAGTQARPMTLSWAGDEWAIVESERVHPQEFAWLVDTAAFEAWLRLLGPLARR